MKTDKEWLESWDKRNVPPENVEQHLKILRQIQADALRHAAEILDDGLNRGEHIVRIRDAILAKAKEL